MPFILSKINVINNIVDTIGSVDDLIEKYQNKISRIQALGYLYYQKHRNLRSQSVPINSLNVHYGISIPESKRAKGHYKLYASNGCIDFVNKSNAKNAVIFGCRGTIGNVFHSKEKCFVLNTAFYIESEENYGNVYFSIYDQNGMKEYSTGAAQPQITINGLNNAILQFIDGNNLNLFLDAIEEYNKILDNLQKIKNFLLHKYFD